MTTWTAKVCMACRQSGTSQIPVATTMTACDAAAAPPSTDPHLAATAAAPNLLAGLVAPDFISNAPEAGMIKRAAIGSRRPNPYTGGMGSMGRLY